MVVPKPEPEAPKRKIGFVGSAEEWVWINQYSLGLQSLVGLPIKRLPYHPSEVAFQKFHSNKLHYNLSKNKLTISKKWIENV